MHSLVLAVLLPLGYLGDVVDPCTLLSQAGLHYAKQSDYDQAELCFTAAIRIVPRVSQLYVYRAMARGMLGKVEAAEADVDASIRLNPPEANALFRQAEFAMSDEDYSLAITLANEALEINPEDDRVYALRGWAKAMLCHDWNAALADAEQSTRLLPYGNPAYTLLGIAHHDLGHKREAYRNSLLAARWSSGEDILRLLGAVAFERDSWMDAIRAYEKLKETAELTDQETLALAESQCELGSYQQAISILEPAIHRGLDKKEFVAASLLYARCVCSPRPALRSNKEEGETAIECLQQAIKLGCDSGQVLNALGCVHLHQKEYSEAILNCRKAVTKSPKDLSYQENLILALLNAGRIDDAREEYRWLSRKNLPAKDKEKIEDWFRQVSAQASGDK